MPKKVIVNESVLRKLLMEMVKETGVINEISVPQAYQKFYSGKIPEDVYNTLMSGTDMLTPLHKQALDIIMNGFPGAPIAKAVSEAWTNSRREVRQSLIDAAKNGELPNTAGPFMTKIKAICSRPWHTVNEMSEGGLKVLFEDGYLRATCTTTYAASTKNFSHTHWCTASDIYGKYNGFAMFLKYTTEANCCLVQYMKKQGAATDYIQAQYGKDYIFEIRDFNDVELSVNKLEDFIKSCYDYDTNSEEYKYMMDTCFNNDSNQFLPIGVGKCVSETKSAVEHERPYWVKKTEARMQSVNDRFDKKYWKNEEFIDKILQGMRKNINLMYTHNGASSVSFLVGRDVYTYARCAVGSNYWGVCASIDSDSLSSWIDSSSELLNNPMVDNTNWCAMVKMTPNGNEPATLEYVVGNALGVSTFERTLVFTIRRTEEENCVRVINGYTGKDMFGKVMIWYGGRTYYGYYVFVKDEETGIVSILNTEKCRVFAKIKDKPELFGSGYYVIEDDTVFETANGKSMTFKDIIQKFDK